MKSISCTLKKIRLFIVVYRKRNEEKLCAWMIKKKQQPPVLISSEPKSILVPLCLCTKCIHLKTFPNYWEFSLEDCSQGCGHVIRFAGMNEKTWKISTAVQKSWTEWIFKIFPPPHHCLPGILSPDFRPAWRDISQFCHKNMWWYSGVRAPGNKKALKRHTRLCAITGVAETASNWGCAFFCCPTGVTPRSQEESERISFIFLTYSDSAQWHLK